MRKSSKLLFVGLTAALLLSLAVGSASANRLSITEKRIRATWAPLRFVAGGATVSCNVTLEGSFHSATVAKISNSLIAHVSRASVNTCTGGSGSILNETLPWHVQYESFRGTLPAIKTVSLILVGASFAVQPTGSLRCLARTSQTRPARGEVNLDATGRVIGLTAEPLKGIPLTGEGGFCIFGGEGHFEGTGAVTRLAETGSITVRLI